MNKLIDFNKAYKKKHGRNPRWTPTKVESKPLELKDLDEAVLKLKQEREALMKHINDVSKKYELRSEHYTKGILNES